MVAAIVTWNEGEEADKKDGNRAVSILFRDNGTRDKQTSNHQQYTTYNNNKSTN